MNMDFLTIADFLAEFEFASNYHFPLKSLSTHPELQDWDRSTSRKCHQKLSPICEQKWLTQGHSIVKCLFKFRVNINWKSFQNWNPSICPIRSIIWCNNQHFNIFSILRFYFFFVRISQTRGLGTDSNLDGIRGRCQWNPDLHNLSGALWNCQLSPSQFQSHCKMWRTYQGYPDRICSYIVSWSVNPWNW